MISHFSKRYIYQPSLLGRDVTASLAMIWLDYFCIRALSSVVHQSLYLLSSTIGEARESADHKANETFVYKKGWKRTHRDRENIWGSEFKFITSFSTLLIWERCTALVTPRAFCFILQVCCLEAKLGQQSSLNWITFGCFNNLWNANAFTFNSSNILKSTAAESRARRG